MLKFKNPLEVNENDTIGTAFFKGAVEGYVKGTVAGAIGLGILGYGIIKLSNMAEPIEEEETEEDLDDVDEDEENDRYFVRDKCED